MLGVHSGGVTSQGVCEKQQREGKASAQDDWVKSEDKSSLGAGGRTETKLQVPKD